MMSDLKNRFIILRISRFHMPQKALSNSLSQPPLLDFLQRPPLGFWNPPPDKKERGDRDGCVEQKNTRSSKQVNQREECQSNQKCPTPEEDGGDRHRAAPYSCWADFRHQHPG